MGYAILSLSGKIMNFRKMAYFFMAFISGYACSEPSPKIFDTAPTITLPIDVGVSSYKKIMVSSSKYIESYESAQNEEKYDDLNALINYMVSDKRTDEFSLNSDIWRDAKRQTELSKSWRVSRLPCIKGIDCSLVGDNSGIWLIVSKEGKVTDFQRLTARQYEKDSKTGSNKRVAIMSTTFGDGILSQQLPTTNFIATGIFCSEIVTSVPVDKGRAFKRRITVDGKIENKQIDGGYKECKEPW